MEMILMTALAFVWFKSRGVTDVSLERKTEEVPTRQTEHAFWARRRQAVDEQWAAAHTARAGRHKY